MFNSHDLRLRDATGDGPWECMVEAAPDRGVHGVHRGGVNGVARLTAAWEARATPPRALRDALRPRGGSGASSSPSSGHSSGVSSPPAAAAGAAVVVEASAAAVWAPAACIAEEAGGAAPLSVSRQLRYEPPPRDPSSSADRADEDPWLVEPQWLRGERTQQRRQEEQEEQEEQAQRASAPARNEYMVAGSLAFAANTSVPTCVRAPHAQQQQQQQQEEAEAEAAGCAPPRGLAALSAYAWQVVPQYQGSPRLESVKRKCGVCGEPKFGTHGLAGCPLVCTHPTSPSNQ